MRRLIRFLPTLLALLLVFGVGFASGQRHADSSASDLNLSKFNRVEELIKQRYPGDVKNSELETGAIKGLVQSIGDPYSAFLTKDEAKELDQTLSGTVEGIGVEVGERNSAVTVIAPLPSSPAETAGVLAGDVILGVDGQAITDQSLDEVVKKIRGPKGSQVKLDIRTPGKEPRQVTITRDTVKAPAVKLTYQDGVAILALSRFGEDTKAEVDKAVADIQSKQARGLILDLRDNPGGYLESAVDLVSVFVRDGVVVKEQYASDKSETQKVRGNPSLPDIPLVVLVNKGSASASEITAGALRDDGRAKLVGEQTFGKGSVQDLIQLKNNDVLKLTIAEWLTPNGTSISKQGLKPDVESPSTDPNAQLQAAIAQLGK